MAEAAVIAELKAMVEQRRDLKVLGALSRFFFFDLNVFIRYLKVPLCSFQQL